jgi:glyoxylase I family protein
MSQIEHVALFAADLQALKTFYEQAMGLRVIVDNSKAETAGYFLADGHGSALEIIARPAETPAVSTRYVFHIAFRVDDYEKARTELARRGARFEADTEVNSAAMRTAFFNDPEGNRLQIVWRARSLGS